MNIKSLRPKKGSKHKFSYYKPINDAKYVGPKPIVCRSSWETKFCVYCDKTPSIIQWSSEGLKIKYTMKDIYGKESSHTYFPDFVIAVQSANGNIKKYIIEVKPYKETIKPTPPKKATKKALKNYTYRVKTFIRNYHKHTAAAKFAKAKGWEFKIVTEKFIK